MAQYVTGVFEWKRLSIGHLPKTCLLCRLEFSGISFKNKTSGYTENLQWLYAKFSLSFIVQFFDTVSSKIYSKTSHLV